MADANDSSHLPNGIPDKEKIEQNAVVNVYPFSGIPLKRDKVVLANGIENRDRWDEYLEDPDIMRLQLIMTDRSPQNIRWAFNHDGSCGSATQMLKNAIIGTDGLKAKTDFEPDKDWIEKYLKDIKYKDIIGMAIRDNNCHAESVLWKDYNKKRGLIVPKWVDYITLKRVPNRFTGSIKWVQTTYVDSQMPENDGSKWRAYEPPLDYYHASQFEQMEPKDRPIKRHIFEEDVLHFHLFPVPPMISILDIVLWKKWMQFDAKLGGQKYSTPLLDVEVTLPETYILGDQETTDLMDRIADDLSRMMAFGVLAHPDSAKVTPISQQGQVFNFTQYLEYAEKVIHKAILLPANLLDSSGTELATSRTTKDVFTTNIKSMRQTFVDEFTELVNEQAEFVGRKLKPFTLIFSEADTQQQMTQNEEFTAIMQLYDRGIMRDENEVRAYVAKFGIELPQLSEEELQMKSQEQLQQMVLENGGLDVPTGEYFSDIEKDIKG